ncbi:TPA: NUDIX domain-containing protein [Candidatus Woesearchaeota archaeon]|nr:NUDIX domain-containing protein [Candidatus Woesearchaeota archaeon]
MVEVPRVTVGVLVGNDKDEFLFVKSHKWHDRYIIPGGHVEFGETLEETVRREVLEETGLLVQDVRFVECVEVINSEEFYKPDKHFVGHNFICRMVGGTLQLNDEAEESVWCSLRDALKLNLVSVTRHTVDLLLHERDAIERPSTDR